MSIRVLNDICKVTTILPLEESVKVLEFITRLESIHVSPAYSHPDDQLFEARPWQVRSVIKNSENLQYLIDK